MFLIIFLISLRNSIAYSPSPSIFIVTFVNKTNYSLSPLRELRGGWMFPKICSKFLN